MVPGAPSQGEAPCRGAWPQRRQPRGFFCWAPTTVQLLTASVPAPFLDYLAAVRLFDSPVWRRPRRIVLHPPRSLRHSPSGCGPRPGSRDIGDPAWMSRNPAVII